MGSCGRVRGDVVAAAAAEAGPAIARYTHRDSARPDTDNPWKTEYELKILVTGSTGHNMVAGDVYLSGGRASMSPAWVGICIRADKATQPGCEGSRRALLTQLVAPARPAQQATRGRNELHRMGEFIPPAVDEDSW